MHNEIILKKIEKATILARTSNSWQERQKIGLKKAIKYAIILWGDMLDVLEDRVGRRRENI